MGHGLKSILLRFGLAGPEGLQVLMVFKTDAELAAFRATKYQGLLIAHFQERLARGIYPKTAIGKIGITFHSHEEIMRGGGYYLHFK